MFSVAYLYLDIFVHTTYFHVQTLINTHSSIHSKWKCFGTATQIEYTKWSSTDCHRQFRWKVHSIDPKYVDTQTNPNVKAITSILYLRIIDRCKFRIRCMRRRSCLLPILYTTLRSYIFLSSLVRFSRTMRKLTLQFIYILCIYNIAVYTLICTGLLAFIAFTKNKKLEQEDESAGVCLSASVNVR